MRLPLPSTPGRSAIEKGRRTPDGGPDRIRHRSPSSTGDELDGIVVIEHGEIEEKGSHEELLEQKGRYYRLYTGQFQLS